VLLMLMITRGSLSLTRKYGAAALTSLKGAVLCTAIMVSHCLSVICHTRLTFGYHHVSYVALHIRCRANVHMLRIGNGQRTLWITPSHVNPALFTMMWIFPLPNSAAFFTSVSM